MTRWISLERQHCVEQNGKRTNEHDETRVEKPWRSLQDNKELIIRIVDKGWGAAVLNTSDYDRKIGNILKTNEYISFKKPSKLKVCSEEHKVHSTKTRIQLMPNHHSKRSHIYWLSNGKVKYTKKYCEAVVSSYFWLVFELSKHFLLIINPLSERCGYIVNHSNHSVNRIRNSVLDNNDIVSSFDVVNLFPSIPIGGTSDIVQGLSLIHI